MDFDAVMTEITSGLTDDPEKDIEYLVSQTEKYKDHEMSKEILRAIGRLIAQRLPQEKMAELRNIFENDLAGHQAVLEEVDFCIYKKEFEKALSLLDPLIEKSKGMFAEDAKSEYHSFDEPFEEMLYVNFMKPQKDVRRASFPFSHLYIRRAGILYELGRHEEAVQSCEAALKWNPVHAGAMFELAENKKMLGDMEAYLRQTLDAFKTVFRPKDLAHCYRNMAYWFVKQKLYREAVGCLMLSLNYEKNQVAQAEIVYIRDKVGKTVKPPAGKQMEAIAAKYGFPVGPDENVVGLAYALGMKCFENRIIDGARYYWTIVYDLIRAEEIKKMLDLLPEEKE